MYIKNKNHDNSSDNNYNLNTNNTKKSDYEQGEKKSKDIEIKQTKIFRQIIMTPKHHPSTFLPSFSDLNPPEKQLYK